MDAKLILKILEEQDPREKSSCLGVMLLVRQKLNEMFELKTYYDKDGLICELTGRKNPKVKYTLKITPNTK